MIGTARLVEDFGPSKKNPTRANRVDPPMSSYSWDEDEETQKFEFVIVSAADVIFSGPETYIFGADAEGKVLDWGELDGSFKGALDHEQALRRAGYEVVYA